MSSLFHFEIFEQPAAIRRLLDAESGHVAKIARHLLQQDVWFILIAARGTSDADFEHGPIGYDRR
jgi:fructoselysine-6-P-deglycase FrlB-like protein